MAKEKVKYGLQNDKEIVEVLDRSENKMEISEVLLVLPGSEAVFPPQKHHYFGYYVYHCNTIFPEIFSIIRIWKRLRILFTLLQE